MRTDNRNVKVKLTEAAACGAAVVSAAAAVICGIWCVLPLALPVIAVAGAGSAFGWLGKIQSWATVLACAIVGAPGRGLGCKLLDQKLDQRAQPSTH